MKNKQTYTIAQFGSRGNTSDIFEKYPVRISNGIPTILAEIVGYFLQSIQGNAGLAL
jgi:hypothetical protein